MSVTPSLTALWGGKAAKICIAPFALGIRETQADQRADGPDY